MDENNNSKEKLDDTEVIDSESENVTREINLDDLYDGSINNTIAMDPVANNELLIKNKKTNHTIVGIVLAILILLGLYYISNKTSLLSDAGNVEPKKTTAMVTTKKVEDETGKLTCNYSLEGDSESQTVTYTANYSNGKIIDSEFNFVGVSNSDTLSASISDLINQYESFYINNASIKGNTITFNKDNKGFSFNAKINYETAIFDTYKVEEGKTVLYVLPTSQDTYKTLQKAYTDKGFTCTLNSDEVQ